MVLAYIVANNIAKQSPPPPAKLPDDNNPGATGAPVDAQEQALLDGLASRIYDDVSGISISGHDNDLYQQCINLSDRLVTALYNTYNAKYYTKYNETLTQVLSGEVEPFGPRKIFAFKDRLVALGLK